MGLILTIFSILSVLFIFMFNGTKYVSLLFTNYHFYAIIGILSFIYFWVFRHQENLTNFINKDTLINGKPMDDKFLIDPGKEYFRQLGISKALLLDICPFVAFAFCFGLVFDRKRNVLKVMSPFAVAGGVITIFFFVVNDKLGDVINYYPVTEWWDFIFGNEVFFSMHYFSLVMGVIVFLNSTGYSVKSIIGTFAFPTIYFIYIGIIVNTLGVNNFATGLVPGDWADGGQYYPVAELLSFLVFPYYPIFAFGLVIILIMIAIFLRNVMIISNKWKYQKMIAFPRMSISYQRFCKKIINSINYI